MSVTTLLYILFAVMIVQGLGLIMLARAVGHWRRRVVEHDARLRKLSKANLLAASAFDRRLRLGRPLTREEFDRLDDGDNAWFHDPDMGAR